MSMYGISLFGMTMCFWMKRSHLEWRIKIVVLLKTCPGLIRKRYSVLSNYLGMTRTLSNYTVLTVLLMLKSWLVIANQI